MAAVNLPTLSVRLAQLQRELRVALRDGTDTVKVHAAIQRVEAEKAAADEAARMAAAVDEKAAAQARSAAVSARVLTSREALKDRLATLTPPIFKKRGSVQ